MYRLSSLLPLTLFVVLAISATAATGAPTRPNIVFVITDDQGYGDLGFTGNPVVKTPHIDRLAAESSQLKDYHVAPTCSPTRAALITGRNHHSTGFSVISEQSTGFPGYNSIIGRNMATIGRILKDNGYATSWFGKNHNVPAFQASQAEL